MFNKFLKKVLIIPMIFGLFFNISTYGYGEDSNELEHIELIAIEDGCVYETDPDKNFDMDAGEGQDKMRIKSSSNGGNAEGYYKFDLGNIQGQVLSAQFITYGRVTSGDQVEGQTAAVEVYGVEDDSWKETDITWNNKPSISHPLDQVDIGIENNHWALDVTEYITEQMAIDKVVSLALVMKEEGQQYFTRGKSYSASDKLPILKLEIGSKEEKTPDGLDENGRSSLYPEEWYPGYEDSQGRFLQDFSYAGYQKEREISGEIYDVTKSPYNADNTGNTDTTNTIQQAINDAGAAGGGIVYLPKGIYKIKPQGNNNYALKINSSNVVLRGDEGNQTFLFNEETYMRNKDIITITTEGHKWIPLKDTTTFIREDLLDLTVKIPVQDVSSYKVGDWVVVGSDVTEGFIEEHGMKDWWEKPLLNTMGPTFYRKIVDIDKQSNTLTIDIPTRYSLKIRDKARVYKVKELVNNVGIENLNIGNLENEKSGWEEGDHSDSSTGAYEVHDSKVIHFNTVVNSWAKNIRTYHPEENTMDYHILSKGIVLESTRNVSVINCDIQNPQYRGAGGNGYLYQILGNDNLIQDSTAVRGRHNYTFSYMRANGNVITNSISKDPSHVMDFHMYLSMANLLDNMIMENDTIEANVRPYPSASQDYKHGMTTTQTVIWNTFGKAYHPKNSAYIIDSRQYGYGYVIGTRGPANAVKVEPTMQAERETAPQDFVQGIGEGEVLTPSSLYTDQVRRNQQSEKVQLLDLQVNGKNVEGFIPAKLEYKVVLPYGASKEEIPHIEVKTVDEHATAEVMNVKELPGTAEIKVVSADGLQTVSYKLHFSIGQVPAKLGYMYLLPDKTKTGWRSNGVKIEEGQSADLMVLGTFADGTAVKLSDLEVLYFYSDNKDVLKVNQQGKVQAVKEGKANIKVMGILDGIIVSNELEVEVKSPFKEPPYHTIQVTAIEASTNDGNVPENILDYDLDTRWSAEGNGQWIQFDLGKSQSIEAVSMAFYRGDKRSTIFDIEISEDGKDWINVFSGQSCGTSLELETFPFHTARGRYLRVIAHGNTDNEWNSITEIRIHSKLK